MQETRQQLSDNCSECAFTKAILRSCALRDVAILGCGTAAEWMREGCDGKKTGENDG